MHPRVKQLLEMNYFEQRSNEWLALREGMLTASDVATALGANPYESPERLIAKKVYKIKWAGNAATAHGTTLEPIARDMYDARYNRKSHEIGLVQHPVHKWLGGSPDGITEDGLLIEIKCPLSRKIKSEVPGHYLPQIQLLLEILDLEECDFIQYRPAGEKPEEFNVVSVKRSREWFEKSLPVLKAFWDRVQSAKNTGLCEIQLERSFDPPDAQCEIELEQRNNVTVD
jgi:putative phage-type endonuclease